MEPVIEERRKAKAIARQEGRDPEHHEDSIEWFEDVAKGRKYNPVSTQLLLSTAAVHTSSDMLTQVMYDLDGQEELIESLREEVKSVFMKDWERSSLEKLRLMDSVLKESQRLKPISSGMESPCLSFLTPAPQKRSLSDLSRLDLFLVVSLRSVPKLTYPLPSLHAPHGGSSCHLV